MAANKQPRHRGLLSERPGRNEPFVTHGSRIRSVVPSLALLAGVVLSLLICGGLLVYGSGRGLDLTDEIFYLIWTRDPNAYALVYQPFGYLLHPLFRLVGGDLQIYRLAGFAIAAAAGAFLGGALPSDRSNRIALALYGAVAALTIFYPWIVTPSYNSAANVGAMLIIGGILNICADRRAWHFAGAFAAGAGLCIAAFSKPPLFAFAVVVMLALLVRRRRAGFSLLAALILGAGLIFLLLPPTTLLALVGRIISSQHVLALPNTPLALPMKIARDWRIVPLPLTGAAIAGGLSFLLPRSRWSIGVGYAAIGLSLVYIASVSADALDGGLPDFIGLALVMIAAGYAGLRRPGEPAVRAAILLLLPAPLAVALGTFNNQWFQLNFSMAFAFLALFALAAADPVRWRRAIARALCLAGPAILMLLAALYPYSLPDSIFEQQTPIRPPLAAGTILVDEETAAFARSAQGRAAGALLIDLSGTGPGVGAVLGARVPILPWLNPATPVWPDVVWSRLSAQQREQAWFVGAVWPSFERSAPARWFAAHQANYCATSLAPMTFWDQQRVLQLWRPCARNR
jgi:hypothetical protein